MKEYRCACKTTGRVRTVVAATPKSACSKTYGVAYGHHWEAVEDQDHSDNPGAAIISVSCEGEEVGDYWQMDNG